jgi:integrase
MVTGTIETVHRQRVIGKLTTLKVGQAKQRGLYGDGGGLFLQVAKGGTKSWIFRWKQDGKFRSMGLGPAHTISLAEAREKARDCRKLRLDRRDPIEERKANRLAAKLDAAKTLTFRQCAEEFIADQRAGWRNPKSEEQWRQSLTDHVYPVFGDLPVQGIDVGLVLKALKPIWSTKAETASRVRGRIEKILDYARVGGYREGENPARWRGHLEHNLPKKTKVARIEHHAALPYAEMAAFMGELRQQEGVAARALEFAVLTAARRGEAIGARWDEINLAERIWIVPPERMKSGKQHRMPLPDAAIVILKQMEAIRSDEYVFPGARRGRTLTGTGVWMVLQRMGRGGLTIHGFRSSFRDWAAERTNFPSEVAEMALAHAVGSAVEQAYRRSDQFARRRQLADEWAKFCAAPPVAGEVVALRSA